MTKSESLDAEGTQNTSGGLRLDTLLNWLRGMNESQMNHLVLFLSSILLVVLSCVIYLSTMSYYTTPGFTIDDSWIHLQFARTIYQGNPWEYSPGYPSTGSTSPLWSLIISPVFLFSSEVSGQVSGVIIISIVFFVLATYMVGWLVSNYTDGFWWGIVASALFVFFPRNTWLMLSGMETPLFMFMLLSSIVLLDTEDRKYDLLLGVVAGLAYLSRPEGAIVALLIPVRYVILLRKGSLDRTRIATFVLSGVFALAVISPWMIHCYNTTGHLLPDTFYAKVHAPTPGEIAAWDGWWAYFTSTIPFIILGVFPGIVLIAKGRPFPWLIPVALTVMYRLSTPYASLINNHRYLVPVFGLLVIPAVAAVAYFLHVLAVGIFRSPDVSATSILMAACVFLLLVMPLIPEYDAQRIYYGRAVRTVNDLHVNIGHWMAENTPDDAVFATHDAGAIRFISNRSMIDLAGLVSPDIIHGDMTPREILSYLRQRGCDYFVVFNVFFSYWTHFLPYDAYEMLYTVHIPDDIHVGGGRPDMAVYRIYWESTSY
ncbi:hypothetical protein EU524_00315 [Candidatus Thorarchaeota archaeon]|nr:MAG: hypothetical protein EU524_00315 [Candidatus Thorarchaeota archaeon]